MNDTPSTISEAEFDKVIANRLRDVAAQIEIGAVEITSYSFTDADAPQRLAIEYSVPHNGPTQD